VHDTNTDRQYIVFHLGDGDASERAAGPKMSRIQLFRDIFTLELEFTIRQTFAQPPKNVYNSIVLTGGIVMRRAE